MGSSSKSRSIGFIALSVLAHIAVAAAIAKYSLQPTEKEPENTLGTTQIEIQAPPSPISGDQQAQEQEIASPASNPLPVIEPVIEEVKAPAAPSLPVKPAPKPVAKSMAKPELPPASSAAKPKASAKKSSSLPTKAANTSSETASQIPSEPVAVVAVPEAVAAEESVDEAEEIEPEEALIASKPALIEETESLQTPETEVSSEPEEEAEAGPEAAIPASAPTPTPTPGTDTDPAPAQTSEVQKPAASPQALAVAEPLGNGADPSALPAPAEIRGIEDLKQMPGNRKPLYDAQDRLQRRQGEVVFTAYVSKEGSLADFRILKSSGHRELDAKTLKALRNWKFYPGQEGWVEIPFQWDLKGGPQEMPTTLRRRAQVSQ